MSEEKFTQGPWKLLQEHSPADEYGHWYHRIIAGAGYSEDGFDLSGIVNPHDAHLIAAATDLYEALEDLMAHAAYIGISSHYEKKARSALAKARGEANA